MESTLGIIGAIIGVLGFALAMFVAIIQVKEQKRHAQERAEEKAMHAQEREWQKQEMEIQKQEMARNNRLMFLSDRIFDPTIPRDLRLPFYEEYIKMGGNGTAVKFWLIEGEREKKAQQPT